jgi:hypothetical protein
MSSYAQETRSQRRYDAARGHLQAEAEAELRGLDIDNPPHLSRSVVRSG